MRKIEKPNVRVRRPKAVKKLRRRKVIRKTVAVKAVRKPETPALPTIKKPSVRRRVTKRKVKKIR